MTDIGDLIRIAEQLETSDRIFVDKSELDTLKPPSRIIGREVKIEELLRFLLDYKKGHVVPWISVYGRSGSGKSTIVRHVCDFLSTRNYVSLIQYSISYRFVNLRKAGTIFGCANLILAEFGKPQLKSPQGLNTAIQEISDSIEQEICRTIEDRGKPSLFILVLDEFDAIFKDKRVNPGDFVYQLVNMQQDLRMKGYLTTIISISNNITSSYEIDDRVKSRMGSADIYFEPYSCEEMKAILEDRASRAFVKGTVRSNTLQSIADDSSDEHGDARRAIELLRKAGELAASSMNLFPEGGVWHGILAVARDQMQRETITTILLGASGHLKAVCAALAKITYLSTSGESWYATSTIFYQYLKVLEELAREEGKKELFGPSWATLAAKPLSYRRFSDRLVELKNTGLVEGQTLSRGRKGYGSQYRLTIPPSIVGTAIAPNWWNKIESIR